MARKNVPLRKKAEAITIEITPPSEGHKFEYNPDQVAAAATSPTAAATATAATSLNDAESQIERDDDGEGEIEVKCHR